MAADNQPNPYNAPYGDDPDSLSSWILAVFLTFIPVVGFIYLIFLAFGQTASPARKNWARATFFWQIIAYVLAILLIVVVGIGGAIASTATSNSAMALL